MDKTRLQTFIIQDFKLLLNIECDMCLSLENYENYKYTVPDIQVSVIWGIKYSELQDQNQEKVTLIPF
jgi:chromatin remodeling complex protein RSC6